MNPLPPFWKKSPTDLPAEASARTAAGGEPDPAMVQAEALRWVALLHSGGSGSDWLPNCRRWCDAHPAHAAAFAEAQAWWADVGEDAAARGRGLEWPPETARSHAYDYQPPAISYLGSPGLHEVEAVVHTRGGRPVVAALVVLAVTAGLWWSNERFDEVTGFGESRTVRLADGSQLQLDTDTAVDIDVGARERRVDLARGGIYVETTPSARQPLLIDASIGQVRAHDCALSVRRDVDGSVAVAVERGQAEIIGTALEAPTVLQAGEMLRFDRRTHSGVQPAAARRAMAWRRGELHFEDEALGRVMDEVRRYDRRLWYGPVGAAAETRVSTVVAFDHIDEWLDTLEKTLPVDIVRIGPVVWARDRAPETAAAR